MDLGSGGLSRGLTFFHRCYRVLELYRDDSALLLMITVCYLLLLGPIAYASAVAVSFASFALCMLGFRV